jgi:hypothetical protein
MKEFTNTLYTWTLGAILGVAVGSMAIRGSLESEFIRDCSITGAHIISNDKVIVCRVVKVDQTRAPAIPKENPEITL